MIGSIYTYTEYEGEENTVLRGDTKDQIHNAIMNDDDIWFQWSLLTVMADDTAALLYTSI